MADMWPAHDVYDLWIIGTRLELLEDSIILDASRFNNLGVSENVVYPKKTNGFHDHYPY